MTVALRTAGRLPDRLTDGQTARCVVQTSIVDGLAGAMGQRDDADAAKERRRLGRDGELSCRSSPRGG